MIKKKKRIFMLISMFLISFVAYTFIYMKNHDVNVELHVIDLPTGDATLIKVDQKNILLGGGTNEDIQPLMTHLQEQEITTLHTVIIPKPTEEYIGCYDQFVQEISIENMYIYNCNEMDSMLQKVVDKISEDGGSIHKMISPTTLKMKGVQIYPYTIRNENMIADNELIFQLILPQLSFIWAPRNEQLQKIATDMELKQLKGDIIKISGKYREAYVDPLFLKKINPAVIIFANPTDIRQSEKKSINNARISPLLLCTKKEGFIVVYRKNKQYMITTETTLNTKIL